MTTLHVKLDRPLQNVEILNASQDAARQSAEESAAASASNQVALDGILDSLNASLRGVEQKQAQSNKQLALEAVRIASIIMQRIIGSSDAIREERLEQLIGEALDRPDSPTKLQVNPLDHAKIEDLLSSSSSQHKQLELVANEKIAQGECRCEFSGYTMTSDLSKQIATIENRLLEVIND